MRHGSLLAILAAVVFASAQANAQPATIAQLYLGTRGVPIIEQNGLRFKDLDGNGILDPYEDWRLDPDARARDIVARMTLEEKAGAMMHGTAATAGGVGPPGAGGAYDTTANRALIDSAKVTSMITRLGGDATSLATQNNLLQEIGEHTRLGIPLTISTDPRNHFQYVPGASVRSDEFSQWPEPLGFAAIGDSSLVRKFATSRGVSIAPSASRWRSRRRPTSPPSRGGAASMGRSEKTPRSPSGWCGRTSRAFSMARMA